MRKRSLLLLPGVLAGILCLSIFAVKLVQANSGVSSETAWANPSAQTIVKIGQGIVSGLTLEDNVDCISATYILADTTQAQSGCFMSTAFGGLDIENDLSTFPGTDGKAIPILPYVPHEALIGWPDTVDVLALDSAATDGSYVNIYTDITGVLKDVPGLDGKLKAKQITAPPDGPLYDNNGQRLVINANSLAYSDGGAWLIVESMNGAFLRINLATLQATPFAPSLTKVGVAPGLNESEVAVSSDGHYAAITNTTNSSFDVYDLTSCGSATSSQAYLNCPSHNYWSFANSQITGMQSIRHIRFVNDDLINFNAVTNNGVSAYELAPTAGISSRSNYLALGDSYTSGEGARDYLPGTNTDTDHCHLSANSYPLLLAHDLSGLADGHSVACSGATSGDILPSAPTTYKGQVVNGTPQNQRSDDQITSVMQDFTPGYVPQANFVSQYQPRVLTVSIGGNDIGFGDILEQCVEPHVSQHITGQNTCYGTYEQRLQLAATIDREVGKLTSLLKRLHTKAPAAAIYIIGYPQIAVDDGSCALNVELNTSELEFSEEIIKNLNAAISKAAHDSGTYYVDISQALAGHRLCETSSSQVAVNGLVAGHDGGISTTIAGVKIDIDFLGKESYHPNAFGHQLIEAAIRKQTENFTAATVSTSTYLPAANDTSLLNAPRSGATVSTVISDATITDDATARGGSLRLNVDGVADGLEPGSSYGILAGGQPAGSLTANREGNLSGTVTLPGDTSTGAQSIDVTGQNQAGDPVDITKVIYIVVSTDDYDGDGISNAMDSCPTIPNSGIDSDQDNIDDICDPNIGPPSGDSTNPGGTTEDTDANQSTGSTLSVTGSGGTVGPNGSPGSGSAGTGDEAATNEVGAGLAVEPISTNINLSSGDLSATSPAQHGATLQADGVDTSQAPAGEAVLGAKTMNPYTATSQAAEIETPSRTSSYAHLPKMDRRLHIIRWLPWLGGLGLLWILVLLFGTVANRHKFQPAK